MKKIFLAFLIFPFFSFPHQTLASTATAVAETEIETSGKAEVYQSVETTVNGQTVRKESSQPGKLELKMEKRGEGEATVSFSQDVATPTASSEPTQNPTPTVNPEPEDEPEPETEPLPVLSTLTNFFKEIFNKIFSLF